MGVILDQFGRKVAWKAARAAQWDGERPWEPVEKRDISELIPTTDRQTLASHARRIYLNFGPIRGAINQRGMYSVGRAFVPHFQGADTEFGMIAGEWLQQNFYAIGDVRGGMHDFKTNLLTWSLSIDVDGEVFVLLTETAEGYPKYQGIPSHRIQNPQGMQDGPMRGGRLQDGIIYWPSGEPKEYAFCTSDAQLIEWLPAANVIHLFDPEWQGQGRGLTALTHCINDCRDMIQSTEWERLAMLQMSSISLIEYNEHGGPDPDDPYTQLAGIGNSCQGVSVQSLDGGTVRYFRSNSGGKIETLQNTRPGNPFLDFHDRLLRSAFAGLSWPYSFYVGNGIGGGTAQRTEIAAAQRAIEDRQDIMFYAAKRIVGYAIAKAQKRGDLPASGDWWKWTFSTPPKLTIDDGRVTKELETMWKMGAANLRDIVSMRGKSLEDHYKERAKEVALRKLAKEAAEAEYGVEIDDREMSMLTPNEQPDNLSNEEPDQSENREPRRQAEAE